MCSRQRYVLGDSAMHKMARSTVFISGMAGLGVEIGKLFSCTIIHALKLHARAVCQFFTCITYMCTCTCSNNNMSSVSAKNIILAGVKVSEYSC